MTQERDKNGVAEIATSMKRRAIELWGPDRAEALQEVIEETARHIYQIEQNPPPADEEPGYHP